MPVLRLRPRFVVLGLLASLAIGAQAPAALAALDGGAAPPVAVDDEKTVRTGSEVRVDVTENDTDADGDFLTVTSPVDGEPTATANGTVTCFGFECFYKSNPSFLGTDGFDYTISDGNGGSDVGHATITVVANQPPTAVDDEVEAVASHALQLNPLGNDTDPDTEQGDVLALTVPEPGVEADTPHGKVTCGVSGECTYTSDPLYVGEDGFDYTVADDTEASDVGHVTITVIANEPPVAVDDTFARSDELDLNVLANDMDAEEAELEITAVTQPAHGSVTIQDGGTSVHYSATSNFSATDSFTYTVVDPAGATDTATVTLEPCPAVAAAIDVGGIVVGERWVACSALVANGVVGPTTTVFPPAGGTSALLTSGDIANAPGPNDDTGATASNGSQLRGARDVSILRLDLNVPAGANCLSFDLAFQSEEFPEWVGQGFNDGFLAELGASTWTVEGADINAPLNFAFDPAGELVSVNSAFFSPERVITDTGSEYDGSTPRLTVRTPVTPGAHILFLSIFDAGDSALDSAAFVDGLTAGPAGPGGCAAGANEPPNAVNDEIEFLEDVSAAIDVLVNDTDADGHPLTITSASPTAQHGTVSCTAATCTYTPNPNYFGPDSFIYSISDGHGGIDTATVSIAVSPQNDPPVGNPDSLTTAQDTPGSLNVLANDTDVDGPAVAVSGFTHGAHGNVACTPAGDCTYTPNPGFHGTDSFTYDLSDGAGGAADDILVSITVTPAQTNQPPVADDETLTLAEDTSDSVNVLAGDTDPDGDPLTVTSLTPSASHGSVTCTAAGVCTYTPNANYHGPDSFVYTVSDGEGGQDTGQVSITVTPVNDDPSAVADSLTTAEDTTSTPLNVLTNDTDIDGGPLTVTTLTPTANHGTVSCTAAGACTYTPNANYHGPDSFTYAISDGHGGADTATVNVTVTPVNDAPNAVDDSLPTAENTAGQVNVLANDTDIDGGPLSVTTATPTAQHGTVACASGGVCTYTPVADYDGPDSFEYSISDGNGGIDTAAVSVTVTPAPVNQPPAADDETLTTAEDTQGEVNVLLGDTDPDGDSLSVTSLSPTAAHGTVSCTAAGVCTYTPNANYNGSDSFDYTVSDGKGGTDTGHVEVTVTPVNDAPDAVNDSTSTPEDTAKVVSVLANDADVDGDTLTVTTASPAAQHGTVACTAAGSCTYTPAANYHGPDSFTYAISDGRGGTDTATVSITVSSVNDPPNAVDDTLTTAQDTAKDLNVFGNDTDDGAFQLSGYTQPAHGSAHCTIAGDCTYTPAAGYHGPDSFTYTIGDGEFEDTATISITVTTANAPPSCANVKPSKTKLWPPRHQFVLITLSGATDADGDLLTFSITKVTQDEKVRKAISQNDKGPDAQRVTGKPNQIKLRSERVASGNGRVYRIHYTVSDGQGGTCTGIEKVGVPKTKTGTAIDNVLRTFNSFG
jgi:large repetitive protein